MPAADALSVFLESLDRKDYYAVLRVSRDAPSGNIQTAFHEFALLYHPDRYVDASEDARALSSQIFKRGVEAYRCLARPLTRARYDRALARGRLRLDGNRPSTRPPPPPVRTLEDVAQTRRGKDFALKAERLIAIGRLEEARIQLVSACQCEPYNDELAERLQILYEALALEPM